jgi:hypothetical protein
MAFCFSLLAITGSTCPPTLHGTWISHRFTRIGLFCTIVNDSRARLGKTSRCCVISTVCVSTDAPGQRANVKKALAHPVMPQVRPPSWPVFPLAHPGPLVPYERDSSPNLAPTEVSPRDTNPNRASVSVPLSSPQTGQPYRCQAPEIPQRYRCQPPQNPNRYRSPKRQPTRLYRTAIRLTRGGGVQNGAP